MIVPIIYLRNGFCFIERHADARGQLQPGENDRAITEAALNAILKFIQDLRANRLITAADSTALENQLFENRCSFFLICLIYSHLSMNVKSRLLTFLLSSMLALYS